jgi:hypothetical protein
MTKDEALKLAIKALEACKEALEQPAQDRYDWNPRDINFDDADFDEARANVVGQNGNEGIHYE